MCSQVQDYVGWGKRQLKIFLNAGKFIGFLHWPPRNMLMEHQPVVQVFSFLEQVRVELDMTVGEMLGLRKPKMH